MNHQEKSSDVATKFQDAFRSAARGGAASRYTCPICNQPSNAGSKLWEHAKQAHPDSPEVTESTEGVEAKEIFLGKAQNKASQAPARRSVSKPSSNRKIVAKKKSTEGWRPISPKRPVSAPSYAQVQGEWIDDTGKLTIGQGGRDQNQPRLQGRPPAANDKQTSPDAPTRKRGAEDEAESPDPQLGNPAAHSVATRGHHAKTASGGFSNQEVSDEIYQTSDLEYRRDTHGATTLLWDPNTDQPNIGKVFQRDRHQSLANNPSRRLNPSKDHGSKPRKPGLLQRNKRQALKTHQEQPMPNEPNSTSLEGSQKPIKLGTDKPLSGGDTPPEDEPPEGSEAEPEMLLQPDTRPISHEQLVVEVKGIYAGLVMVEAKCIDIDERQSAAAQEKDPSKKIDLKNDQWQSLIALHKQLLHEHHDFFLASQHPSASPALSRLAAKYSMPARMWRHGIHAFLEVLRHRLPQSLEHMLAFIYIAYSMMALLYETVSTFEDTWIECLGDLGRYRMAIEDDEPKDREVWSNVARFWYNKAADKSPNVGRLYHHLAILARPYTLEQLSLYTRSLTCVTPFESAKGSIMTLFNPILNGKDSVTRRSSSFETIFIRAHGILFTKGPADPSNQFNEATMELEADNLLDNYVTKIATRFKEIGVFAAVANIAALFEYGIAKHGVPKPILRLAFEAFENANIAKDEAARPGFPKSSDSQSNPQLARFETSDFEAVMSSSSSRPSVEFIALAAKIAFSTLSICLRRLEDPNVHPLVHVYLVFLRTLVSVEQAMKCIEAYVPWNEICSFLNSLSTPSRASDPAFRSKDFPESEEGLDRPLPEDFVMRGQLYSQWIFPEAWFAGAMIDDDERSLDLPSMAKPRADRIFWHGHIIASAKKWIYYDEGARLFWPTDYASELCEFSTTETLSDQIEIKAQTRADFSDEDSAMEDVGTIADTPRTMSFAPSDSQDASEESTRASTPTENCTEDVSAVPDSLKHFEQDDVADDITMKDAGPEKISPVGAADGFDNTKVLSWPSSTIIDPDSSPWKSEKTEEEPVDYASDPQKLEELLRFNDPDRPELYKP
ncbi:MAG: hypothetical protein ASARMPREDX12_000668 [Alectoria sarmentosa]|nr:MAG: hypothetical protein ASARMPREDX12_000668 [Alectoria sarmentosa]